MINSPEPGKTGQKLELDLVLGYADEYPNSAFIELSPEVTAVFGAKGRIPVKLSVDGHVFRSSLAPMGGRHMMVFNREMREATGYKAGDRIHLVIERDTEPRQVEIPEDVLQALEEGNSADAFSRQAYSHQKETVAWINEAKKPETRSKRIQKLVQSLKGNGSL